MDYIVQVTPGSKGDARVENADNPHGTLPALKVWVSARAVDGAANAAVIAAVAAHLGVRKSDIHIHRGHNSRTKTLRVDG